MTDLSFDVVDLTSRLGIYAREQLGVMGLPIDGKCIGIRSKNLPDSFVINWHHLQSSTSLLELQPPTVGLALIIGPGSMNRLPKMLDWVAEYQIPVWFLISPSAIVEEVHLRTSSLPNSISIYTLPNSDPKTLWFVLTELFVKAGDKALIAAGYPNGFTGENIVSINIKQAMDQAMSIDGALAAALVDYHSGMCLAQAGNVLNLELAAAGNTQVVRAKLKTVESLGLRKGIEDILITLADQYHLIRLAPNHQGLFLYLVLDKEKGNLALARYKLTDIERSLQV